MKCIDNLQVQYHLQRVDGSDAQGIVHVLAILRDQSEVIAAHRSLCDACTDVAVHTSLMQVQGQSWLVSFRLVTQLATPHQERYNVLLYPENWSLDDYPALKATVED